MSQLILAAVPLGNIGDASTRLREALASATHIAAEDSRKLTRLCKELGITHHAQVISFFEGNESEKLAGLIDLLKTGHDVLLVTDAGMPTISDPGFRLVRECVAHNIQVSVIPGPSAVITALALSGLPTDRFCFEGFVPRTSGARDTFYLSLAQEPRTIVVFEAPHRLQESLESAVKALGSDRAVAVCREMTKTYEEVFRGTVAQSIEWCQSKEILGEITIVIGGFNPSNISYGDEDFVKAVTTLEAAGQVRKEAIAQVAQSLGVPKRLVFDAMVRYKDESE